MHSRAVRRIQRRNKLKKHRRKMMMTGTMLEMTDRLGGLRSEIKRKLSGTPRRPKVRSRSQPKQKL
jgi:hypothetical protein